MRILSLFIASLMIVGFLSWSQTGWASQGKSENSDSGNSNKSENSGQGSSDSKSSERDDSHKDDSVTSKEGSNKSQDEDSQDKLKSGKNTDTSPNKGQGSQESHKSELKKGGKFLTDSEDLIISTDSGKIKKLAGVRVTEASMAAQSKRRAVMGVVTSVSGSELTLVHQIHQDRVYKVLWSSGTLVQAKNETATSSASIVTGIRVIVVGDLNSAGQLVASRIKVIPGKAKGVFNKITPQATGSGSTSGLLNSTPTMTASPSAKPEVSP